MLNYSYNKGYVKITNTIKIANSFVRNTKVRFFFFKHQKLKEVFGLKALLWNIKNYKIYLKNYSHVKGAIILYIPLL